MYTVDNGVDSVPVTIFVRWMMEKFFSLCLQGDVNLAMEYLSSVYPRTKEVAEIERLYKNRFYSENVMEEIRSEDSWICRVIEEYCAYFRAVLTKLEAPNVAELKLNHRLCTLLDGKEQMNIVETELKLKKIFHDKGYYFLGGVTKPFRGPFIWKHMEEKIFFVETPFASQWVTVYMMSNFLLESWIGYATFGRRHAGGWAKDGVLFCNSELFKDLKGADFQISFLKHEAQHIYDFEHFPWLESHELEYRAKLVELIYIQDHSILARFFHQAKNDPNFPHPFASYRILKNLSSTLLVTDTERDLEEWLNVDYKNVSSAARELLEANTEELRNKNS